MTKVLNLNPRFIVTKKSYESWKMTLFILRVRNRPLRRGGDRDKDEKGNGRRAHSQEPESFICTLVKSNNVDEQHAKQHARIVADGYLRNGGDY